MYKILIVDFSIYKNVISKIFTDAGYSVESCESAYDAMSKLKAFDFDLIVSEIELPGDNAFDLYNYIQKNYPYIPTIMTTEKNIDSFFEQIFQEGIGNVLCKPVKKYDILNLSKKMITKENIFDLKNYMVKIEDLKKIRLTSSIQIQKAVFIIIAQIQNWGFEVQNEVVLNLLLNEMIINAVYHSHGYTDKKLQGDPIQLKEDEYVDVFFGKNQTSYGISINDYNGRLSKTRILDSINRVIQEDRLLSEAVESGEGINGITLSETGRGIEMVRKLCSEYYFIIKRDVRTEIILIFDPLFTQDNENYSSLKIIEEINQR